MALTLTKEPTNPCFSKNLIAYQVESTLTFAVIGRLFVETAPYSDTWEFVTDMKAWPDADGMCYYYLQQLLEEDVLRYDRPSFSEAVQIWPTVCRRFKIDFYEYDPAALVLVAEVTYGGTAAINFVDLDPPLSAGIDYVAISDTQRESLGLSFSFAVGDTYPLLYALYDEYWFSFNPDHASNLVHVMKPGEKITFYEGTPPALTTSTIRFALLGGLDYSQFTILTENYFFWGQEDYDLIVDENGNFIGIG